MNVHIYLAVPDLEQAVEFYRRALGLTLRRRLDDNWVELEGASAPIFLLRSGRPGRSPEDWTVHLDFIVDDLEAAAARAREAGAAQAREIQSRVWGRMANLVDPFGNPFDLIELAPGGYDRIRYPRG